MVAETATRYNGTMVIAAGETDSGVLVIGGRGIVQFHLPTMTAASLTFMVRNQKADPDYALLVDAANETVTYPKTGTTTGDEAFTLPELAGFYDFYIVSTPLQAAERTIYVSAKDGSAPVTDIDVTVEGSSDVDVLTQVGAANIAVDQVATATTAGGTQVLAARATRRSVTFKNTDTAITIYLGVGTLTSTDDSIPLLAGESINLNTTAAIKALSASGTPRLAYIEVYD